MYPEAAVFKSTRPSGSDNAEPNSTEHSMLFLHQKIRATHYSRTVYIEKWQYPPPPPQVSVKLCFCESVFLSASELSAKVCIPLKQNAIRREALSRKIAIRRKASKQKGRISTKSDPESSIKASKNDIKTQYSSRRDRQDTMTLCFRAHAAESRAQKGHPFWDGLFAVLKPGSARLTPQRQCPSNGLCP
jgi:hypothetical protein